MASTRNLSPQTESRSGDSATSGSPAAPTPTVLGGRYRLDDVLGVGGMAVVHRGLDLVLHRTVAVKVFRAAPDAADASSAARYEHEARVLASLNSAGLVTVYDAGVDANGAQPTPFLVMEYVAGATLADVLRDGPLAEPEVARLGCELATALAYVHRHGVVHRDVKPANILLPVPEEGAPVDRLDAKLTDFGISRLVDGGGITTMNRRLGTVAYLSPEQVRGEDVGPASDVYSLGLVLAECLAATPLFPGNDLDAAAARLQEPPALPATASAEWGRLLRDMLDLDPGRRPTAAEVSVALTGLMAAPAPDSAPVAVADPEAATTAIPQLQTAPPTTPTAHASGMPLAPQPTRVLDFPAAVTALPKPSRRLSFAGWSARAGDVPWRLVGAVIAALLVFVVIAAAAPSLPTPQHVRPPAYPSVPGQLGTDLAKLQQQVQQ